VWLRGEPDDLKTVSLALFLWSFGNTVRVREKICIVAILADVANESFGNRKWQQLFENGLVET
jgi:hypothetical protein